MSDSYENDGVLDLDQQALEDLNGTRYNDIVCWGDSLTAGNVAGASNAFPVLLSADLSGERAVLNNGIGGQTSGQIAARMLGAPSLSNDTVVIWAGYNNLSQGAAAIEADIASMVQSLGANQHYVVLSVLNGETPVQQKGQPLYNEITGLNSDLSQLYAGHYLDVRSLLVNAYNPSSPVDSQDAANDIVPTSLRVDSLHLNRAGNTIVARALADFITTTLDGPPPPTFDISGSGSIVTEASRFDFTGFTTGDNRVTTDNASGTTFIVDTLNTAMHIIGGSGFDAIIGTSLQFSDAQKASLFAASVDEVVDASGTYIAPNAQQPPTIGGITTDTGASAVDGITNVAQVTLFGTAAPSAGIQIFGVDPTTGALAPAGTSVADEAGAWSVSFAPMADGSTSFVAQSGDATGYLSAFSAPVKVTVDTVAPNRPVITKITGDTGASSTDGITRTVTLQVWGTAEPNAFIQVSLDGQVVGTTRTKGGGSWNFYDPTLVLAEGAHQIVAVATDTAGNQGAPSTPFTVTVDTTPPVLGGILVNGAASNAKGIYASTTGTLALSGSGEAGGTVQFTLGGANLGATTVDATGQWTFRPPTPLAAGTGTIMAREIDLAGNAGPSASIRVAVTPLVPATVTGVSSDTGASATDGVTRQAILHVLGTAGANASVQVFADGTLVGSTHATSGGAWTFYDPTLVLAEGAHQIVAVATDTAGNQGAPSTPFAVTVDTTPPVLGGILVNGAASNAKGIYASTTGTLALSGSGEAGGTVQFTLGGANLGATTVDATGQWTFRPPTPLAAGTGTIMAREIDLAGNAGPSASIRVAVTPLVPATVTGISSDTGASATDGITRQAILHVLGTAGANASVQVFADGTLVGSTHATSGGAWTFYDPTLALAEGAHQIVAVATDTAGNQGAPSTSFTVTVDTTPPVLGGILVNGAASNAKGVYASTTGTLALSGSGEAGGTVQFTLGGANLGATTVDATGQWAFRPSGGLGTGSAFVFAKETDLAGNVGPSSAIHLTVALGGGATSSFATAFTAAPGLSNAIV